VQWFYCSSKHTVNDFDDEKGVSITRVTNMCNA